MERGGHLCKSPNSQSVEKQELLDSLSHKTQPTMHALRPICLGNKKINFSQVFAGQAVGIKGVHHDIWLVSFTDYDLGYFDLETRVLEPLDNPFGPKVLPMS